MKINFNISKFPFEKFFAMTGLIILFLAACSNSLHSPTLTHSLTLPKTEYIQRIVIKHDTIVRTLQTDDADFRRRVEKLIHDQNDRFDTSEEKLKDLTVLLSQQNLYLSTRARMFKSQKDSIGLVMIQKLDSSRRENIGGFKQMREAQTLNKSTYSMFETIGTICFVIVILTSLINIAQWIATRYRKLPAL